MRAIVAPGQGSQTPGMLSSWLAEPHFVTLLTESLRFLESWRYVIYAVLIIAMMWLRPQGIAGASNSILAGGKIKRKPAAAGGKGGASHG